jgi:hypothetical protein
MSSKAKRLGRRAMLRGAGGLAIALPWLEATSGTARAAPLPKRFVAVFSACGTHPAKWFPIGGETDFQLSPFLAPLEPHRQDIVIFKGISMLSTAPAQPGDDHQRGIGNLFTGVENTSRLLGGGISIDQQIARSLAPATKFRTLELGVEVFYSGDTIYERISYLGPGQPTPQEDDPVAAFKRVFGSFTASPAVIDRLLLERRSVLDFVQDDFRKLSAHLGGEDKIRVDGHLTAVRAIETRLTASPTTGTCGTPAVPAMLNYRDPANFPVVGKLQMDLLAAALACDQTRVASLMWSQGRSLFAHMHLGVAEQHHDLSHRPLTDTVSADKIAKINVFYAQQFGYLLDKLKSYQEGAGTLLDNTAVLWGNELGEGRAHTHVDVPFVLAGRAGGAIRTGRYLVYGGVAHNNLMVSMLNAMGVATNTFGDPNYATGPLPGLLS